MENLVCVNSAKLKSHDRSVLKVLQIKVEFAELGIKLPRKFLIEANPKYRSKEMMYRSWRLLNHRSAKDEEVLSDLQDLLERLKNS
jgi:hypothetical protein